MLHYILLFSPKQTNIEAPVHDSGLTPEEQKILDSIPVGAPFPHPQLMDPAVMLSTYRSSPDMQRKVAARNPKLKEALDRGDLKAIDNLLIEDFRTEMKIWTAYQNKLVFFNHFPNLI